MKIRNSWIGVAFMALGAYFATAGRGVLEPMLYATVGAGFVLMDAAKRPSLAPYKKLITILSWVFVLSGVLLFIALLRQDAYSI